MLVYFYVDDMVFAGNNSKIFVDFKKATTKECEMTDIGSMSSFLGLEVNQSKRGIFISPKKNANQILVFRKGSIKFGLLYTSHRTQY